MSPPVFLVPCFTRVTLAPTSCWGFGSGWGFASAVVVVSAGAFVGDIGTRTETAAAVAAAAAGMVAFSTLDEKVRSYISIRAHWAIRCTSSVVAFLLT